MAEYGKIYKKIWTTPKMLKLPDDAKLLWIYLLTSPHSNCSGFYRISHNYIMSDLKWDAKSLAKVFGILLNKGLIKYDYNAEVILIPSWFEYNNLNGPNQLKKARAELSELPKTILAQQFNAIIDAIPDGIPFVKSLIINNGITYPETETEAEAEAETEAETETETAAPPEKDKDEIPYKEIIDHLNSVSNKLFKSETEATRKLIRGRWAEGYRLDDFKKVHENKAADEYFIKSGYLRPSTLYRPLHFEEYWNQTPPPQGLSEAGTYTARSCEIVKKELFGDHEECEVIDE